MNSPLVHNPLTQIGDLVAQALAANVRRAPVDIDVLRLPELQEAAPHRIMIRASDMVNSHLYGSPSEDISGTVDNSTSVGLNCGDCHGLVLDRLQSFEITYFAINCANCPNQITQVLDMSEDGIGCISRFKALHQWRFELARIEAPDVEQGVDTPFARVTQHWQARWKQDARTGAISPINA